MFGKPFKLFTISGIPIQADASVAIIALLIGAQMNQIFVATGVGDGSMAYSVLAAALFLGSILWHEGAHALVARLSHIHVRSVTLYMFGGATSADLDSSKPREEFLVALVGPFSSLVLSGILWLGAEVFAPSLLAGVLGYMAWINLLLAIFNMIPGFPLDGGRVLRAGVTWITGKVGIGNVVAKWIGSAVGVAFLAWAAWNLTNENLIGALWIGYIGFMVLMSSQQMVRQEGARGALRAIPVARAAQPRPGFLQEAMSLSEALDASLRAYPTATFPVLSADGKLVGMITMEQASAVGQHTPLATVAEAMGPVDQERVITADDHLLRAAELLAETPWLLVLQDDVLTGIISMDDVERAFQASTGPAPQGPHP